MVAISLNSRETIIEGLKFYLHEKLLKGAYRNQKDPFFRLLVKAYPEEFKEYKEFLTAKSEEEILNDLTGNLNNLRDENKLVEILDWLLSFSVMGTGSIIISKYIIIINKTIEFIKKQEDISIIVIFELFSIIRLNKIAPSVELKKDLVVINQRVLNRFSKNIDDKKYDFATFIGFILLEIASILLESDVKISNKSEKMLDFFKYFSEINEMPIKSLFILNALFSNNLTRNESIQFIFYQKINKSALSTLYGRIIEERASIQDTILFTLILFMNRISFVNLLIAVASKNQEFEYYPFEREKFFSPEILKGFPEDIKKLIKELESCFYISSLIACAFLIRRIFETSIHLKAKMVGKLDEFKKDAFEFKKLEEFPDVALKLNFLSKTLAKASKDLIKFGDEFVHNYKLKVETNTVKEKIQDLVKITQSIFYDI